LQLRQKLSPLWRSGTDEKALVGILLCICVLAFVIRLGVSLMVDPSAWKDSLAYMRIASSLISGHGFSQGGVSSSIDYRSPLYPIFLAVTYKVFGGSNLAVQVVQAILGAITCWLVYAIGQRLFNTSTGILSALIMSVYPPLVYVSGLLMSEQLFIFLLILSIFLLIRNGRNPSCRWTSLSGICLGLASLTRPAAVVLIPFFAIYLCLERTLSRKRRFILGIALVSSAFLIISSWTIRNYVRYHEFIPISTAGGFNFYLGNNDLSDGSDTNATIQLMQKGPPGDLKALLSSAPTAKAKERVYYAYTLNWIKNHPGRFLLLYVKKLANLWRLTPDNVSDILKSDTVNVFSALILIPLYVLSIIGMWLIRRSWRRLLLFYFVLISMSFGLALYITSYRFRIPLDPILILFSAYSLDSLIKSFSEKPSA
jgi:4-amino-4-deoxy-L-arabinose transferase-like glycosyltransferase